MKIKDFAEEKQLTKQAIYKAISRAGFTAKQITDRTGNITAKGFSVLRSLFPDSEPVNAADPVTSQDKDSAQQKIEQLEIRVKELEQKCSEWEKRYFDAIETAKQEGQQLRILLSQEQQLRLAAENKGFIRRLFSGRKESENSDK